MSLPRLVSAITLAVIVAAPLGASAQTAPAARPALCAPQHHHHRHHHRNAFMRSLHTLTLSDQQKQQIRDLAKSARAANHSADRATHKANEQKLHDGVLGLLTPDQKTQLQAEITREKDQPPAPK